MIITSGKNGNDKYLINHLKIFALNKTTALLQDVWSAYLS